MANIDHCGTCSFDKPTPKINDTKSVPTGGKNDIVIPPSS